MATEPCLSCNREIAVGAKYCEHCGASQDSICPSCGNQVATSALFCSSCGTALAVLKPEKIAPAERRQMAVLFCDLIGSTELSQKLDAEDLRDVIRLYHDAGAKAITRYDGFVAKYLGDGIMAFFGFPVAHEDDSRRSVLAGLAIVEAAQKLNPILEQRFGINIAVRVGIHTGLVVAGEMGSIENPVLDIVGETPNLSARLQELAPPNEVVVSAETHLLAALDFEFESLGPKSLRGVSQEIEVFRVLAASEGPGLTKSRRQMVGRDEPLQILSDIWKAAKEGRGQSVMLSGEPGIGKSTLVNSMVEQIEMEDESVSVCLRCSPYHQNTPFFPLIEYLRSTLLQISRLDSAEAQLTKLVHFIEGRGFEPAELVPILAPLLSIPYEHKFPAPMLSAEGRRIRTFEIFLKLAVRRATQYSVLLVLDNIHWADPSTLELFQGILQKLSDIKMLAIATYRPYFKPDWANLDKSVFLRLERLDQFDVESLVRQAAGGNSMPDEIMRHILAKTDGVPLFVEELTRAIIESGVVRLGPTGYDLNGEISEVAIPSTLHGSLVARLERVKGLKEIAQVASVIGREFTPELIAALSHRDESAVGKDLENLVSAELIYPIEVFSGGKAYRFRHALIQDAAYDSLLKSSRQQFHSEIAQTIETRFADTAEDQPEMVATHYSSAGMVDVALQWWSRAGQKALSRSANIEAISHFTKGLDLLEQSTDSPEKVQYELGMLVQRGMALIATRGFASPEVGDTFRRAELICELIGETPLLFPVIWGLWVYHLVRSELEVAVSYSEQMLRLAEISKESGMFLEGHFTFANALFWLGRFDEAKSHLDEAFSLYNPVAHQSHWLLYGQDAGVSTLCYSAYTYWALGYPEKAYDFANRAHELATEIKHPFSIGWALAFGCSLRNWNRDYGSAKTMSDECRDYCSQQGQAFWLSASIASGGIARYYLGEREKGLELLRQGISGYEMTGSIVVTPLWRALLAEVLVDAGELDEAMQVIETGLATVREFGEAGSEPFLRRVKGDVFRLQDKNELASAEYLGAFEQASAQNSRMRALQAAMGLVKIAPTEMNKERLRSVFSSFTEGFQNSDLEETKRLLNC